MLPSPEDSLCYARSQLGGDGLRFYDSLVAALRMGQNSIAIGSLDANLALQIAMLMLRDHPEFYWLANTASAGGFGGKLKFPARLKPSSAFEQRVMARLRRTTSSLPASCDDYSKAKSAFTEIAAMATYDSGTSFNEEHAIKTHSLWGVFSGGTAVCDGFSSALQFLLQHMGMTAYRLTGDAESSGCRGPHSWVLAKVDGHFCHIDPTWGLMTLRDCVGARNPVDADFDFLCLTDDEIRNTHFASESIRLPICNEGSSNYYRKEGYYVQSWDERAIVGMIAKQMANNQAWISLRAASDGIYRRLLKVLETSADFVELVEQSYDLIGKPSPSAYRYEYSTNGTLRTLHFRLLLGRQGTG